MKVPVDWGLDADCMMVERPLEAYFDQVAQGSAR
jgi:hypothetical protein